MHAYSSIPVMQSYHIQKTELLYILEIDYIVYTDVGFNVSTGR
jgi:hypothetical protein